MSLKFTVGDLTIHRIIEQETSFLPALEMFPDMSAERLAENRAWMRDAKALDHEDTLILCFQSYVIETPHHTILVDTCIGNDKARPTRAKWHMKTDDAYIGGLKAAGFSVADIDFVMCTHLHPDHVGWNTRLENGRWVPTFPRARYLMGRIEFDYWKDVRVPAVAAIFDDSVRPVADAGLIDLIDPGHDIGSEFSILSTPGHSPGHSLLRVESCGESAMFIGDIVHHPLQIAVPDCNSFACMDALLARQTRKRILEACCERKSSCRTGSLRRASSRAGQSQWL